MISGRSLIGIGMCALVSLVGSNTVFGQTSTPSTTERVAALETRTNALEEKNTAPGLWKTLGFQFSGAVEASYTQNFNNPQTNVNSLRIFDTQANSFVPNIAQFMVERHATDASAMDRVGFRARIDFGPNARFSRARTNYQLFTDNVELDPHELYAEYLAPIGNGLLIQFGKINTLVGLEVINSWDNPNFSRSFTFGLAQPFTQTGIRFTYAFGSMATATIGLTNGWDNIEDTNRGKSIEYLLAFTPHPVFGISFYGSYGAEQSNGNSVGPGVFAAQNGCTSAPPFNTACDPHAKRLTMGSLITIKPTDSDTLILEPYYGNESNASFSRAAAGQSPNARWNALLAYYMHDFNDQTQPNAFSLHVRGEIFEDAGGARTCGGFANFNGNVNQCAGSAGNPIVGFPGGFATPANAAVPGTAQTLWEGTVTLQWKPAPSLMTRTEFRYDKSNKNVFLRGDEATNNQQTVSFSVVYLF